LSDIKGAVHVSLLPSVLVGCMQSDLK